MNHFKRKFIQSLSDFSATERAKYPNPTKPVSKGRLFSDEFLRKNFTSPHGGYCEVDSSINRETQTIESWLEKVPKGLKSQEAYGGLESFADAIKVLLSVEDNQSDLSMLLMLAGHPSCNLTVLHSFGQSFDFGWGQAVDVALEMYLFVNIVGNTPGLLDDGKYARMEGFQDSVVYQIQQGYGRALEPHKLFWEAKLRPGDPFCGKDGKSGGGGNGYFPIMTVDFFEDIAYLKESDSQIVISVTINLSLGIGRAPNFRRRRGHFLFGPSIFTSIPEAAALNGVTILNGSSDIVLIADSALGAVWRVNVATGDYSIAIQDPFFTNNSTNNPSPVPIGINGVRTSGGMLYFTNSAQGSYGRIPITDDGSAAGEVEILVGVGGPSADYDDFDIDREGNAWIATHPNAVVEASTEGKLRNITRDGNITDLIQPVSVKFGRGSRQEEKILYVVTAGSDTAGGQVIAVSTP
ncbi:MAG: hypothetical protein Q9161_006477 [Pseudevernia consocians]